MNTPPITPAASASSAGSLTSRFANLYILLLLRTAWIALTIFEVIYVIRTIPIYLTPFNNPNSKLALLERNGFKGIITTNLRLNTTLNTLAFIFMLLLAVLLLVRSRHNLRTLLFSLLFVAMSSVCFVGRGDEPPYWADIARFWGWLAIVTLVYLFPDGRFVPRAAGYVYGGAVIGLLIFGHIKLEYAFGLPVIVMAALLIGLGFQLYRYRQSPVEQRQQLKWALLVLMASLMWVILYVMTVYTPNSIARSLILIVINYVVTVIFAGLPLVIFIAITRYHLWDIDLIINRSLVYGVLALLVVLVFGAIALALQTIIGQTQPLVALIVTIVISVLAFNPTRHFIQHQVDRRIYNLRYDLNQVAAAQQKPDIKNPGAYTGKHFGDYEALGVIGRGGMGEVYKGFGNSETVAIKLLLPDLAQDEDLRKRFEREASILAQFQHPNIVQLKSNGISDGVHFLAMEYIDGQDMSALVKEGALNNYEALHDWMTDIAAALDTIHAQGLVHRDLKASNIMLRNPSTIPSTQAGRGDPERMQAVVMDFGIARTDASGTRLTGTGAVGTIDYMAPEQIMAARDVDKRADLYALGVIVYELLTGERPFKGSAGQVLFAHLQQPAPDPRDINPDIPRDKAKAVMQALAKNPDERFQSAGEFAAALSSGITI